MGHLQFVNIAASLFAILILGGFAVAKRRHGNVGLILAAIVVALSFFGASFANLKNAQLAASLVQKNTTDHVQLKLGKHLALVREDGTWHTADCDGLCRNLLLSGLVEQVLVPASKQFDSSNQKSPMIAHTLKMQPACNPDSYLSHMVMHGAFGHVGKYKGMYENENATRDLILSLAAEGMCLQQQEIQLKDADSLVIVRQTAGGKQQNHFWLDNTGEAWEISYSTRDARQREFTEVYKQGIVQYAKFPLFLVPTKVKSSPYRRSLMNLTYQTFIHEVQTQGGNFPENSALLADGNLFQHFGDEVSALPQQVYPTRPPHEHALWTVRNWKAITANGWVGAKYFPWIVSDLAQYIASSEWDGNAEDANLFLTTVGDVETELTDEVTSALAHLANRSTTSAALQEQIGRTVFGRIGDVLERCKNGNPCYTRYGEQNLDVLVAALPNEEFMKYSQTLRQIAEKPEIAHDFQKSLLRAQNSPGGFTTNSSQ
jgi:hypothetical protein